MENVHYLQDNYTTVSAVFLGGVCQDTLAKWNDKASTGTYGEQFYEQNRTNRHYTFKADTALGLKVDDLAVVQVRSGFAVVQIVAVHDTPTPILTINGWWIKSA